MHPATYIIAAVAIAGFALLSLLGRRNNKSTEPQEFPGPALIPWVGRVHDLPVQFMWTKFEEWAKTYGPIYRTKMLGAEFIIISDEAVAEELLVKRAKTLSDRPAMRSLFDSKSSQGSTEYLPLMGKNQYWARQRRFTHGYLTAATNAQYYGIMHHEAKRWLYRLLENPDDFCFSLEDMASKVMCTLTWDDHSFSAYYKESAWGLLTQMSPAGPITNVLTPLWHLPMIINPWKRAEHKRHDEQNAFWMERLMTVRRQMEQGTARHCFTRQYLENEKTVNLSGDYEASCVLGMMALVGIFTVGGPLYYFLCCMVFHPEWQKKLQAEIDRVCGDRPPVLDDAPNMPILRACIKETLRWCPNVPTGVAHEAEADEYYRGCIIRKGARILPLDCAFMKNEKKYPDAAHYRPERFLEPGWPTYQEPLTQYPNIKELSSFGYGQRRCLGISITQDELFVACGALMWGFNLKHKIDPTTGKEIPIDIKKSNSLLIIKPDPWQMVFEPRSANRKQQIVDAWLESEAKDKEERAAFRAAAEPTRDDAMGEKPMMPLSEEPNGDHSLRHV